MRKIVFHKLRTTLEAAKGLKLSASKSAKENEATLMEFEKTSDAVLNVPSAMVTGWKTLMWSDEVEFEFVGEGFSKSEIAQGKNRATPAGTRD